jgi:hypothetical protein
MTFAESHKTLIGRTVRLPVNPDVVPSGFLRLTIESSDNGRLIACTLHDEVVLVKDVCAQHRFERTDDRVKEAKEQ